MSSLAHLAVGLMVVIAGMSDPASALAESRSDAVASDSLRHLAPGGRWTLAVPLSNPSAHASTFRVEVHAPSGWSVARARETVTVPAHGRDLAFISLAVGRTAPAGRGVMRYLVTDEAGRVRRDSVRYSVGERRELSLLGTAPPVAATGTTFFAAFVVTNRGNTPRSFDVHVVAGVPATLEGSASRTVASGAADTIVIRARVPSTVPQGGSSAITVRLQTAEPAPAERLSAFVETAVFSTGGGENWVRLPLQITPTIAGRDGSLAIESRGPFGRGGAQVDLVLRGPRRPTAIAGASDEYRLALTSSTWQLRLGDQPVRLTPLTENGRVATGASAAYTGRVWSASLGDVITRQPGEATHLSAQFGTIGVQLPSDIRLRGTALVRAGRADSGTVGGMQLSWSPSSRHVVELEGDRAQRGGIAWRAKVGTSSRRMQVSAAILDADTTFPGYARGSRSVDGQGRLQLSKQLWARASVQDRSTRGGLLFGRDIANPDTLLAHEPTTEHRYRNATFTLGMTRALQVEARWRRRDDPAGAGAVWGAEQSIALASSIGSRHVRVSPRVEIGDATSSFATLPMPLRRASLDMRFTLGRWGAFSPAAGLDLGRSMYDTTERRSWHAGAQLELHAARTRAIFGMQYGLSMIAGPWTPPAPSRRADVSIIHELPGGDELLARMRWDPQARQLVGSDTRVELGYRLRVGIPVAHPARTGWVRGRIDLEEKGTGLKGVMVRLDDRLAMTSRQGEFQFSGVPAGSHVLDVDRRTLGDGRLVRDSALRTIRIVDGRETRVSMSVVQGGSISGRVLWYDRGPQDLSQADSAPGGSSMVLRDDPPRLHLLLRSGSRLVRVSADGAGRFSSAGLEPGRWQVTVDPGDLPPTHRVQSDGVEVVVPAGRATSAELRILPRPRTLHVLTPTDPPPVATPGPPPAVHGRTAPSRRRTVPLQTPPGRTPPVVRDVPLLPGADAPAKCSWPIVRPNGPICQEPAAPDSTSTPREP